jgi:single-strand DNA-binding protein
MNNVTMIGRLTEEPNLKHVGDRAICEMRIAVDNGRHPTTYIDVAAFDGQAYTCAEYLGKGRQVGVTGKLALDEWRDAGGRRHQRYKVIGHVQFLERLRHEEVDGTPIGPPAGGPEPAAAEQPELTLAA